MYNVFEYNRSGGTNLTKYPRVINDFTGTAPYCINFSSPSSVNFTIYPLINLRASVESHEFINLYELIDYKYKLKKPIKVKIIRDGSEIVGEIPELDIYAFGDTPFEVLREINRDVTELFEEIFSLGEEQLGTAPKEWKKILDDYIEKESD
jgi:hypothetical protein